MRALVRAAVLAAALCIPAGSAIAATLTRGPYLQLLGTDAVTIVWNTDVAAACAVRIRTVGGEPTVVQGATGKVCVVPVSGLTPGTTYGYVPLADGSPLGDEASFRTDHPALPYTFLVFGDSGNGSPEQFAIRDRMLATHADLMLHTGDMIYPEAETAAWNPKYFMPYADLLRKLVLWPCLGNHDVRKDNGKSWRAAFITPANNAAVDEDYYSFDHGNAHFVMLDSNASLTPGSAQHTFLNQNLAASTAAWNFVFFHHTIYSGGEHGSDLDLQERLVPVFDALGVDVVFMGHDHHYERTWPLLANQIVQPGQGTLYITTGGGGAELRDVEPRPFTEYAESSNHFLKVAVAGQSLRVDMVRADGSIGDSVSLLKAEAPACGDGVVNQIGEACDGADDVACPGRCEASCMCAPLCGDGVQQAPAEECDWLDDSQCPGLCIADCTCAEDPGSLDLAPLADTFIEARVLPTGADESNWDHGGEKEISVDADPHRIAYLKFDVSAVTRPVASASLSLYCINSSDTGGTIHPVADSGWIEGTGVGVAGAGGPGLKWTDVDTNGDGLLDGADTSPYLPLFAEVITEIGPVAEDDRYLMDVAAALEGGPGLLTLAIADGVMDGAAYASREDLNPAERPLLHVEFDLECRSDQDCTDGVLCNGTERCLRGHCAAVPPEDCDDGSSCTVDACDVLADECRHFSLAEGSECDDGDQCTQVDECRAGACVGGAVVICGASDQCHVAPVCDPATGLCAAAPAANGTQCDDGNACTQIDTCQAGVCVGSDPVDCPAIDPCHAAGTCNPATGLCVNPPLANGTPCEDGNLCTTGERCQGLVCRGGVPVVCTAADQCHTGACDPASGECSSPPAADGTPCDDGDACTQTDTCQAGTCVGGGPVVCTASDQCHVAGTCDPASGQCSNPPVEDSTPCDDGSACTQSDSCQAGACVGADPIVCPAPEPCHTAGVCNPGSGQCTTPPAPNGTPCDDGNACTRTDTCQAGTCVGSAPVVCTASDQCHVAGTCDQATGQCTNPAAADGTPCSDGNACTQGQGGDVCQAGTCVGGAPVVCTASDQCHVAGTCNPATGQCTNPPAANGTFCSDGNACTQMDTCQAGTCTGSNPLACPAPTPCHSLGVCNPTTGQCSNPTVANGTPCDDGNACTRSDTCQGGSCIGSNPVVCVVSGQCDQAGVCNPATGACEVVPKANGSSCSDGNPCTLSDTCQSGACVSGAPMFCGPLDQCHATGTCNPATGQCSHPAKQNGAACDDGNPCTLADTCQAGVCAPGAPKSCPPLDQCHQTGVCQRATGQCLNVPMPNGSACQDGNPCTQSETCQVGACVGGTPVVCTPLDACHTAGVCDPATGCSNPAAPDGTPCDDGSVCTQEDECHGGVCSGTAMIECTPLDQCHDAGECDPVTGVCSQPAKADGEPCDDGDLCTEGDACMAGACVAGAPVQCAPLDSCHDAGACDPATGACSQPAKADGTACDDGNACTHGDVCAAGACLSGTPTVCVALDQCHAVGTCDPATGACSQPAKAAGTPCDDGNRCTEGDACQGGACTGGVPVVCTPVDACHDASCDPATGVCSQAAKGDGAPCDDGNRCTEGDACHAGACVPEGPVTCTPLDQCHAAGTCDPATGLCSQPAKADGAACDDGNRCTRQDACASGACVGSDPVTCTAIDQCHDAGACEPATGSCSRPAKADGTSCDDGAFCTVNDACAAGVCRGAARVCAADACRNGVCDEELDACTSSAKPNGAACDDGAFCTIGDVCQAGACAGTPRNCGVGDACKVGRCEEAVDLCVVEPKLDGTPCDDGAFCTVNDACAAGVCRGGARVCAPLEADGVCRASMCDEATDACTSRARPNGTVCDDGAYCTVADACRDGSCRGTPRDCRAAATNPCQDGRCDEALDTCVAHKKADGVACSDADACTRTDTCVGGICTGRDRVACTADDQCQLAGVCDPATGGCSYAARPDGVPCDDGDACTAADRCLAGRCTGDPLPDADADGVCDDVDGCPLVADPAQADADGDGIGDLCQCTAPAPGRCVAGDGSRRTDCLLEFITTGRPSYNRRGTKLKSLVWCADGDPACDIDETRDGVCTFGVALCFGNADPRFPACTPFPVRSVEVVSPSVAKNLPLDQLRNIQAVEGAAQALGLQVRHGGQIIVPALRPVGDGLCGPLMRLTAPAPASDKARGMQRTFKVRAVAADGRRDQDRLVLMCER